MSKVSKRNIVNTLNKIYFDVKSPASYAGANKVYKEAKNVMPKIKYQDVKDYLQGQSTYTMYKPRKKNDLKDLRPFHQV
jgi:hypothetical protein